ncbi:hypothetical protein P8452_76117 [Trifolium repens]|nr:hypothetical protein P8452_76117 [Trifolium repens]
MESVTAAIESAVGLEESFHWLFLRMDVDISRLLARALAEQLPLLPSISFPFCLGTGPSYRSMGTSIDSAIGKVRHGITLSLGLSLAPGRLAHRAYGLAN